MRAAFVFGSSHIVISGNRYRSLKNLPADTVRAWKHMPIFTASSVFDHIPCDCVLVAIDLIDGARQLPQYTHPERAMYIFGAEDSTLGPSVLNQCRDVVSIPTNRCMNLAACVNVVLYDRMTKLSQNM